MANKKMTLEEKLEEAIVKDTPYEVPENWIWTNLEVIFDNVTSSKKKLKQKEYENECKEGYIEVIDQGESFIGGYTDKKELAYDGELPVIIFGDHSKCIKFVDFNFVQGADGVKVFLPRGMNRRYLYYMMKNLKLPDKGYSRHYKFLREEPMPIAPLREQQRIVDKIESLFEKLDKAKELIEEATDDFEKRKSAMLEKAFRGELTKVWRKDNKLKYEFVDVLLGDIIEDGPKNGLYKPQSAYGEGNMIVRIDNFYNGKINPWNTLKKLKLTEDDISKYSLENGDIIINRVNSIEYLGKSALVRELNETCVFESNIMRVRLNKNVNNEYVVYYLNSIRGLYELRKTAKHAVNQASINQQDVKRAIVPLPSLEEQNEIVKILDKLLEEESKIEELTVLEEQIELIKKSILAKAFRGQLGTNCEDDENALELLKEILNKE